MKVNKARNDENDKIVRQKIYERSMRLHDQLENKKKELTENKEIVSKYK